MKSWNTAITVIVSLLLMVGLFGINSTYMSMNKQNPISIDNINEISSLNENVFIWETIGNPDTLDPHVDYESFGNWISYNVYETLYTYPWDSSLSTLIPLLASGPPTISMDGLNYTIELREGITFHDGTPFNASCVKWNIERAMKIFYNDGPVWIIAERLKGGIAVQDVAYDTGSSSPEFIDVFDNWIATSGAIEVVNTYTIKFILREPYSPFIAALTYSVGSMISPSFAIAHASDAIYASWEDYGVDYGEYENYMTDHTCGTGPYTLTQWIPNDYIRLDLNSDYWRTSTSTNAGSIDTVYIKINENLASRTLNLQTGISDGCYWPTEIAQDIYNPYTEQSLNPDIYVSTGGATYSVSFLGFNLGSMTTPDDTIIMSPFANKAFRKAASYAFDYNTFIDTALNGIGRQGKGPIPCGMFGYNETSYQYEFNIDAAVAAWNQALTDPDFIDSVNALGCTIKFYYPAEYVTREKGCLLLADGLNNMVAQAAAADPIAAGLDMEVTFTAQGLEWLDYIDYIIDCRLPIFFVGWTPDYADPDNYVTAFCYHHGTFAQRIAFNNSAVNSYVLQTRIEDNLETRQHYYNLIHDIMADETPYLWTYQSIEFRTWRTWAHGDGLIYNPMHDIYFYHMYKSEINNTVTPTPDTSPPQIDSPSDITISFGATGVNITWVATDANPGAYDVTRNEDVFQSGEWSDTITVSLDNLSVGQFNFTCIVRDLDNNTNMDSVIVTVTNVFEFNQILLASISLGSIAIITIVVISISKYRR